MPFSCTHTHYQSKGRCSSSSNTLFCKNRFRQLIQLSPGVGLDTAKNITAAAARFADPYGSTGWQLITNFVGKATDAFWLFDGCHQLTGSYTVLQRYQARAFQVLWL